MADYTLYYAPTPNGKKIALAMEEMGLSYSVEPIRMSQGDQHKAEFKKFNPNSKIPTIVDHTADDLAVFESGAILEYLAEKTSSFLPPASDTAARYCVKQWLYWQMAGFGPMLGQFGFFWKFSKDDVPVAKERYLKEAIRLFEVLDARLAENKYMGGDDYSIADMATYFWSLSPAMVESVKHHFQGFENVKRWQNDIGQRDAIAKVDAIPFEW